MTRFSKFLLYIILFLYINCGVNNKKRIVKKYHLNGNIESVEHYRNNVKEGSSKYYFDDGIVSSECNYLNGFKNGIYISYYNNGSVCKKGCYVSGELEGEMVHFSLDGDTLIKQNYEVGALVLDAYYKKGVLKRVMNFKDKTVIIYDKDGFEITRKEIK